MLRKIINMPTKIDRSKTAFIAICSEEYLGHYRVLYNSLKRHSPGSPQILYYIGNNTPSEFDQVVDITSWSSGYKDKLTHICSLRARVVLNAFDKGYLSVVHLGSKVEFFNDPVDLINLSLVHNAVGTPHITSPLPEDGKFPSNAMVNFTGHLSTDLVAFKNTRDTEKFLKWQDEVMKSNCETTNRTYLDQSWLNFLPFFVNDVLIYKHHGYNVAYWNYEQRNLHRNNNRWYVDKDTPLIAFQYSGLEKDKEEIISRHQNRWKAEGDFLEFLKDYNRRVYE